MEWVESVAGSAVSGSERLQGGWTSEMRRIRLADGRSVVLRSFVSEFFRRHADGLLSREAAVLRLLEPTGIAAATLLGVDPEGRHCEHPSLLMTLLPGRVDLEADRSAELAEQLAAIHRVSVGAADQPRTYQAWTTPDGVRVPEVTDRRSVWESAVSALRREVPEYEPVFLHRDFHPGNVLFDGARISGVVDWVETSWGPADLDVAHCSTALALLHGAETGLRFADLYEQASGRALSPDRQYWLLLDALAYAPDAQKVAEPWRELGRTDLTPHLLQTRLEDYLEAVC